MVIDLVLDLVHKQVASYTVQDGKLCDVKLDLIA